MHDSVDYEKFCMISIIYKQLPEIAQKAFENILTKKDKQKDWTAKEWFRLSEETLDDIWSTPENDIWDQLYKEKNNKKNIIF